MSFYRVNTAKDNMIQALKELKNLSYDYENTQDSICDLITDLEKFTSDMDQELNYLKYKIELAKTQLIDTKWRDYINAGTITVDDSGTVLTKVNTTFTGKLELPSHITRIDKSACSGCTKITDVIMSDSSISIDNYAFSNCTGLTNVRLSKNMNELGSYIFQNCTGLKTITLPESITTIPSNMFTGCTNLEEITISQKTERVCSYAFSGCSKLSTIHLTNALGIIENNAFDSCTALTIYIPLSVFKIGNQAFLNVPQVYYDGPASGSPWGATTLN